MTPTEKQIAHKRARDKRRRKANRCNTYGQGIQRSRYPQIGKARAGHQKEGVTYEGNLREHQPMKAIWWPTATRVSRPGAGSRPRG